MNYKFGLQTEHKEQLNKVFKNDKSLDIEINNIWVDSYLKGDLTVKWEVICNVYPILDIVWHKPKEDNLDKSNIKVSITGYLDYETLVATIDHFMDYVILILKSNLLVEAISSTVLESSDSDPLDEHLLSYIDE